jgi:hypothetical protein
MLELEDDTPPPRDLAPGSSVLRALSEEASFLQALHGRYEVPGKSPNQHGVAAKFIGIGTT